MTSTLSVPTAIGLLVCLALPLVVGLVTRPSSDPSLKALLLLALTVATSGITALVDALTDDSAGFGYLGWFALAAGYYAVTIAAHFGCWVPIGATERAQRSFITDPPPTVDYAFGAPSLDDHAFGAPSLDDRAVGGRHEAAEPTGPV
jgi:hypothetical protein